MSDMEDKGYPIFAINVPELTISINGAKLYSKT